MRAQYQVENETHIMSKWTNSIEEIRKFTELAAKLWAVQAALNRILIKLKDGREITGRIRGGTTENDGHMGSGNWKCSGSITLEEDSGEEIEIDLLDIERLDVRY
jgi:hypothetical protein